MSLKSNVTTFLLAVVYLAVIFVLVRPGSQGPSIVTQVSQGLASLISAATGGGTWSGA